MPDEAVVMSAPAKKSEGGKAPKDGEPVTPLRVKVGGVTVDAVRIKAARYEPAEGDMVNTVPLSDGRVLLLGPS